MSSSVIELYQAKLFELVKTITIKHVECARAINLHLKNKGYQVDEMRPETWKYYLNLSGEYHQYDKDILSNTGGYMQIKIAGLNGPVESPFTKDLIQSETVESGLANEYRYGTRRYKELISKYQEFELLIRGILNPIDINLAISAPNNTILFCGGYYPVRYSRFTEEPTYTYKLSSRYTNLNALIEEQETNLIPKLQEYVNLSMVAYNTQEYEYIDDLYIPTILARLYALMPGQIELIRMHNTKTPFVHTFHIREYLNGYGYLGQYIDDIPREQVMWLYRNVDYLSINMGRQSTFDLIVDNMLTPTNIPISGFRLKQDTTFMDIENNCRTLVENVNINLKQVGAVSQTNTLRLLLEAEAKVAKSNILYLDEDEKNIDMQFTHGIKGSVETKALESVVIDYSDPAPYDLNLVMLNLWLYTSVHGIYNGSVYINNPTTNERLQLTPLNAYILMLYCLYKAFDLEVPKRIPTVWANWVPSIPNQKPPTTNHTPYPDVDTLYHIVNQENTTKDHLKPLFNFPIPRHIHTSISSFKTHANTVYETLINRYYIACMADDHVLRADLENASRTFYWDNVECKLSNLSFDTWLLNHGIELTNMLKEEYFSLAVDIVTTTTGADTNSTERLRRLQNAMINILKHHSSYTVQYLAATTLSSPIMSNAKTLRMSKPNIKAYGDWNIGLGQMSVIHSLTIDNNVEINIHETDDELDNTFQIRRDIKFDLNLSNIEIGDLGLKIDKTVNMSRPTIENWHIPYAINNNEFIPTEY